MSSSSGGGGGRPNPPSSSAIVLPSECAVPIVAAAHGVSDLHTASTEVSTFLARAEWKKAERKSRVEGVEGAEILTLPGGFITPEPGVGIKREGCLVVKDKGVKGGIKLELDQPQELGGGGGTSSEHRGGLGGSE